MPGTPPDVPLPIAAQYLQLLILSVSHKGSSSKPAYHYLLQPQPRTPRNFTHGAEMQFQGTTDTSRYTKQKDIKQSFQHRTKPLQRNNPSLRKNRNTTDIRRAISFQEAQFENPADALYLSTNSDSNPNGSKQEFQTLFRWEPRKLKRLHHDKKLRVSSRRHEIAN